MTFVREFALAARLLWRDGRAGELHLIGAAVVIAVAAVTTVGFFTDRVHQALNRQANQLLGGDLVLVADRPLPLEFERAAFRLDLATTRTMRFLSMARRGEKNLLTDIKAVSKGYPLRGEVRVADGLYGPDRAAREPPAPGTVWIDERLATGLGVAAGEQIGLGEISLRVAAILTQDPDSVIGFLNAAPRLLMNGADVGATGLVQPASRIRYRLQIAGEDARIGAFRAWAAGRLPPGSRLEGIGDARPEIRAALERAEKFLGLAALVSVVLAAVAISLAARRFLQRHLDGCAMMRCLGATQGALVRLHLVHFALLGCIAAGLGGAIGGLAQQGLAYSLGTLIAVTLPAPSWLPALQGAAAGLLLLLGFAMPPLAGLGHVSTLRVLRRELGAPRGMGLASYSAGAAVIAGLIFWKAADAWLGAYVLGVFSAAMIAAGALVWVLLKLMAGVRGGVTWRFGVANLRRRTLGSIIQVVALALGIMALLTLTLVRSGLLAAWKDSLAPDAPNRFIINIQPDQLEPMNRFFAARGIALPRVFPMVRGRLVALNGRRVSPGDYADERARRLVDREFNLSWATGLQADNRIVAGRWWGEEAARKNQFSIERGIAETLGIKLGDVLTYDVAGSTVEAVVTSLRKVDWDTFNVNFFVIAPPGLLEGFPASHITSFHLPAGRAGVLDALVKEFPNFLVIDVAQVMTQVRRIMDQVARAVQFVFLFTLAAGVIVLYAAIAATLDERLFQATIMRTLGASRAQLARANLAEFAVIGAFAGTVAAAGASVLSAVLARKFLNLSYAPGFEVWITGVACGSLGVALAGYLGARKVVNVAPLQVLRSLG